MTATPERLKVRTFAVDAQPSADGRRVSGIVVPWNTPSRTYGANSYKMRDVFLPGSVRVPTQQPTPLLEAHDDSRFPIGKSIDWEDRPEGLRMTFEIAPTPRGEEALTLIDGDYCRGFSVGVGGLDEHFDEEGKDWTITGGDLLHVALTPQQKLWDAKVDRVFDMSGDRPAPAPTRSVKATWPLPGDQRIAGLEAEVKRLKLARHMDKLEALRVGS